MNPQNPYQGPPAQQPQAPQPYPPQQPSQYSPQPQPDPQLTPLSSAPAQSGAYPVDYLNQIAPPSRQKTLNKVTVFGLMFGFLAVIGFVLFLMMQGSAAPDITAQALTTRDRAATLMTAANEQRKHFNTNKMTSTNATLAAALNSMNTSLSELAGGKNAKNKNKSAVAKEQAYSGALSKKLNDAYLAGTLDRTYATQMAYELRIFKSMIQKMRKTSKADAVVAFYDENIPTIDAAIKQLSEFTE